jgi:hypothetical protein
VEQWKNGGEQSKIEACYNGTLPAKYPPGPACNLIPSEVQRNDYGHSFGFCPFSRIFKTTIFWKMALTSFIR